MAETPQSGTESTAAGDRRQADRRRADRRKQDRRAPPPLWRRPWALVLYGVVGTLFVVLLFNRSRPTPVPVADGEVVTTAPVAPAPVDSPSPAAVLPEDARRPADFERLMAEGDAAKGRHLRVELYCSSISQVALRSGVTVVEEPVAVLADTSNRVPAAECKWGRRQGEESRADFLLLVPPELAERFAGAPSVEDGFVRRRRIEGIVEWVGRSDALALRTVGVLREYPVPAAP